MPTETERNHSISCGGFHLIRDSHLHMAEIGAACRYDGLSYKNVQKFWMMIKADPRFAEIRRRYEDEMGEILGEIGNALGLEKGKITENDLADIEKFRKDRSSAKSN